VLFTFFCEGTSFWDIIFLFLKLVIKRARETLHKEMPLLLQMAQITTKKEKRHKPNSNTSVKKKGMILV
jgi:hypothetical protein